MTDKERKEEVDRRVAQFEKNWHNSITDNFPPGVRVLIMGICYLFLYIQFFRDWLLHLLIIGSENLTEQTELFQKLVPWWEFIYLIDIAFAIVGFLFFRVLYNLFKESLKERGKELADLQNER